MLSYSSSRERGATLTIAMIMLVLITLFVLAAINMSTLNLRIIGNEQVRSESLAATQQAIEQVASGNFPVNLPPPQTIAINATGGGVTYNVSIPTPACEVSVPIKQVDLDASFPQDQPCFVSAAATAPGVAGAGGTGDSFCASTQWEIVGTGTDAAGTSTTTTIHQGIGQRVPIGTLCPPAP